MGKHHKEKSPAIAGLFCYQNEMIICLPAFSDLAFYFHPESSGLSRSSSFTFTTLPQFGAVIAVPNRFLQDTHPPISNDLAQLRMHYRQNADIKIRPCEWRSNLILHNLYTHLGLPITSSFS